MATYRDETETLRARVAELEQEVATLQRGRESASTDGWSGPRARIFGAPFALVEERTLDATLDDALLEEILETLRTRFSTVGTVARTTAKGAITWHCGPPALQRIVEVTLKPEGARTRVRIVERIGQLAGGLFGGIVGGVGGGVGLGVGVPLLIEMHRPWLLPLAIPATLVGVWLTVRAGFTAAARRRARELADVMAEIERAARAAPTPKTRVIDEPQEDEDESASRAKAQR